jgi:isopenicillin N synthase-like dioxygenase
LQKLTMEAPSSPKSAALYYWGGNNDTFNGIMDDNDPKTGFYWEEVQPAKPTPPAASHGIGHWRHGGRPQLKFTLSMDDDDTHWMFVRPHAPISLGGCFIETDLTMEEKEDDGLDESETTIHKEVGISGDFDSIPIVDLSLPLEGTEGYATQIAEACRSSGFFYIINHGVDHKLMNGVLESSRHFFDLGLKDKMACSNKGEGNNKSSGYRGYFGIGMEDLENKDGTRDLAKEEGGVQHSKGDQKEGFDCGLECIPGYHENELSRNAYIDFFGDNSWPDECAHKSLVGFRETLVEYQKALLKLSDKLMISLAISLSSNNGVALPMDYFIARSRSPMCTLRLLHYPPTPKLDSNNPTKDLLQSPNGCGAHTDYGLFTILQQDDIGGLQIRNKFNTWIDARPLPGSFVINVGDMLSWWTNGEYASTVHRVISPALMDDGEISVGKHRYSIPFFFNPDHDAIVRAIQSGGADYDENKKWKSAIEILKERYYGTFKSK